MTSTREREDTTPAPAGRRFTGLLPRAVLRWRRPIWWQEIAIIAFGYWLYGLGRNAIPKNDRIAFDHARWIQHAQEFLHIDFELAFNHWVAGHEWFAQTCDYYYATLHFIVTPGVMIWLFLRRRTIYRGVRTVIVVTSLLGLLCFYLFPTAPPRLLPGYSYVDTVLKFHTWGSLADPHVADHSNQYAAMPSLHIAWAAWAGWTLFRCARHLWVRIVGIVYPFGTLTVILGTANHFLLDGVGGVLLLMVGFGVQYLMSGHGAYRPAPGSPPAPQRTADG